MSVVARSDSFLEGSSRLCWALEEHLPLPGHGLDEEAGCSTGGIAYPFPGHPPRPTPQELHVCCQTCTSERRLVRTATLHIKLGSPDY